MTVFPRHQLEQMNRLLQSTDRLFDLVINHSVTCIALSIFIFSHLPSIIFYIPNSASTIQVGIGALKTIFKSMTFFLSFILYRSYMTEVGLYSLCFATYQTPYSTTIVNISTDFVSLL